MDLQGEFGVLHHKLMNNFYDSHLYYIYEYLLTEQAKVYRDWETDRKSTRLNSSHSAKSRMPSSA